MSVLLPATLAEALAMLAATPDAIPIAGATDLFVHWPQQIDGHDRPYLDLSGLDELRRYTWSDKALVLGARTTYWDLRQDDRVGREFPLLHEAARQVGSVQIQARGTWAGNIVNASPAADGVPVLMAYDAVVHLASTSGTEDIPLADFYLGYKETRRRSDQLITSITIPRRSYAVQLFEKVGARRAQAITKVGVAVTRSAEGWRVVANSLAPTVCRCLTIERLLTVETSVSSPDNFLPAIRADVAPIDDIRSTADYRETVFARLLYYDLREHCTFIN